MSTARGQLLGAEQTGRSALDQLRRLLGVLRDPDPVPQSSSDELVAAPLTEPLRDLSDVLALANDFRGKAMEVRLVVDVALDDLDRGLSLTAYRVVHEGLTNALKHSPGAEATVSVTGDANRIRVEVTDRDGRQRTGPGTGFGLLGLRERVALYGGQLQACATDTGWRLLVELPRRPTGHAADRLPVSSLADEVAR